MHLQIKKSYIQQICWKTKGHFGTQLTKTKRPNKTNNFHIFQTLAGHLLVYYHYQSACSRYGVITVGNPSYLSEICLYCKWLVGSETDHKQRFTIYKTGFKIDTTGLRLISDASTIFHSERSGDKISIFHNLFKDIVSITRSLWLQKHFKHQTD